MVVDLASLGIGNADESDSGYVCSSTHHVDKSGKTSLKNKTTESDSFVSCPLPPSKPSVILNEIGNRFSFPLFCKEMNKEVEVLVDTGAMINLVSDKLISS